MNHITKKLLIISFSLIIAIIIIQSLFHFYEEPKLNGVAVESERVAFTLNAVLNTEYQSDFERWFSENYGFRYYFIKNYNQMKYSAFSESPLDNVVIGKEKVLFEPWYIQYHLKLPNNEPISSNILEKKVIDISKVQEWLLSNNKKFMMLITPSKTSYFPELIPESYSRKNIDLKSDYDNIIPLLDKYGINYYDAKEEILTNKLFGDYKLFPQNGTHWTLAGSFIATQGLLGKIEETYTCDIGKFENINSVMDNQMDESDNDLIQLMNLIYFDNKIDTLHVTADYNSSNAPKIFIQGGSFCGNIISVLDEYEVFSNIHYQFYGNTIIDFPSRVIITQNDFDQFNITEDLLTNDIIIFEVNEENIDDMHARFIELVLDYMKSTNEYIADEQPIGRFGFDPNNSDIDFIDNSMNLLSGSYGIETDINTSEHYVWLKAEANIEFDNPSKYDELVISGYMPFSVHKQTDNELDEVKIKFYINDVFVSEIGFKEDKSFEHIIQLNEEIRNIISDNEEFRFSIICDNQFNPKLAGINEDTRDLAFILNYIVIQ